MGLTGAHVSTAGGFYRAVERGTELGCRSIQIFSRNQRRWTASPLNEEAVERWRRALEASEIEKVLVHASYLINLAGPDPVLWTRSVDTFLDELARAERLQAFGLVFHPGACKGASPQDGVRRVTQALNRVCEAWPCSPVRLLIENTAGQGSVLGSSFEELGEIIDGLDQPGRFGVCYDTAHGFAAGYALNTPEAYDAVWTRFHRILGLCRLEAFHLNDSRTELGSRVDRHENPGFGFLGLGAFQMLMHDTRFDTLPMILETPGGESWFRKNLDLLNRI